MTATHFRAPTFVDLVRTLDLSVRSRVITRRLGLVGMLMIVGGLATIIAQSTVAMSNSMTSGGSGPMSTQSWYIPLGVIGLGMCLLLVAAAFAVIYGTKIRRLVSSTELAELPVNDIFEGDVLGPWVVVQSDLDSLHATLPGTQVQTLVRRFAGLALGVLVIGSVVAVVAAAIFTPSAVSTGKKSSSRLTMIKGVVGLAFGGLVLIRWALKPVAYQWLITMGEDRPVLEIHRLKLFGRTQVASVHPGEVTGFTLVDQKLSLVHGESTIEIASVLLGAVGRWQAACIATAVMSRLDPARVVSLSISGKTHLKPCSVAVPAEFAEDCPVSVTTGKQDLSGALERAEALQRDSSSQARPEPAPAS